MRRVNIGKYRLWDRLWNRLGDRLWDRLWEEDLK